MLEYLQVHAYTVIGFLAFSLLIALGNSLFLPRLRRNTFKLERHPFVSILVPARNEELNIERCVRSLLMQDYPAFTVMILDDHSTDSTRAILEAIQKEHPKLQIMDASPLPSGWLGKHWACHQLAQAAPGELLLFTDADTWHEPYALRDSVSALLASKSDLLTVFPHEHVLTWGEKLTVPVLAFAPFSFVPVFLARQLRISQWAVTIGQFMLFQRSTYEAVGGYAAVRSHPLDDVTFGRRVLKQGFKWLLVDGMDHVHCRMYRDFDSSLNGLTRSLFAFFTNRAVLYVLAWLWIGVVFLEPLVVLALSALHFPVWFFPVRLAWTAVIESILLFAMIYYRFRIPFYLVLVYPVNVGLYVWLAFRSLIASWRRSAEWKDRDLPALRL